MKKNKISSILTALIATFLLGGVVYGGSPDSAVAHLPVIVNSTQSYTVYDETISVPLPMKQLVDNGHISSDGLNMHLHEGDTDVPFLPGSSRIDVKYAFDNGAVEKTTQATNTTVDDVNLPTANGEIFEFSLHHLSRILHLNISQGVAATSYEIDWEYYNGSGWASLVSVTDNTNSFSILGQNTITISEVPSDWALSTLHTTKQGYWLRAVATASGVTTVPLASQAWYETGRGFFSVDEITASDQKEYKLHYGGSDMSTYHYYFPGFTGITTADDADIEPGTYWTFLGATGLKLDSGEAGNIVEKTSAFTLGFTASATVGGNNTLTLNAPSAARYGEWTHNEEDGSGYYSGTGAESYSKTFYNASSNYATSREEGSADILSNTGSSNEVTDHKVGQAYDKVIDTTAAFGDKIDDPT